MERLGYARSPDARASSRRRSSCARSARRPTSSRRRCTPSPGTTNPLTLRPKGHRRRGPRLRRARRSTTQEAVTRWYYLGPMFRARAASARTLPPVPPARRRVPAAIPGPGCDAEMIDALVGLLGDLGVAAPDVVHQLGRLAATRGTVQGGASVAGLDADEGQPSADYSAASPTNPLRILDSKRPGRRRGGRERADDPRLPRRAPIAPTGTAPRAHLDALGTPYKVDQARSRPRLPHGARSSR